MSNLIFERMMIVMSGIGAVEKNKRNSQQGYAFRGIEDMYAAIHPLMIKAEIFAVPRVLSRTEDIYENKNGTRMKSVVLAVEYDFVAKDGSRVTIGPIYAEGMDSGDKATNKALSIADKYAIIQAFKVPTEDIEDADKDSPELGHGPIAPREPVKASKPKSGPVALPPRVEQAQAEKAAKVFDRTLIVAAAKKSKWLNEHVTEFIKAAYGVTSSEKLTLEQCSDLVAAIEGMAPAEAIKLAESMRH